ncbi:LysE family transporter [Actinocrinis puniceicyclus]|uniref:LysE family transporter n=2 Tax=Actinocrinis puniceicyclus TaxID=977794 RepID=A0A8J7WJP6_9ACTN|nr:LysE family transporter [Actinocrinis puniceicyclus]
MSLIVAIGAQNAYVLRQGLRREHVGVIVAICTASDAVLIAAGIGGLGALVRRWPHAVAAVAGVGGVFLICYGLRAALRALRRPDALNPRSEGAGAGSLGGAVLACLALTWLNPHVYLDTVLLLGSAGNSYGSGRWFFAAGAATGSALWFGVLGFGARRLARFFARPRAWSLLDGVIAVTMTVLGTAMLTRA